MVALESKERKADDPGDSDADDDHGDDQDEGQQRDWRPHRRGYGLPDAGVVTLEEQRDEEFVFGPAAPLVAEWRRLRTGSDQVVSRVDRAQVAVRRLDLEAEMLGEHRLTLPPDTYSLGDGRRADHVRWRRDALAKTQRKLGKAKLARLLRWVFTLGLWGR